MIQKNNRRKKKTRNRIKRKRKAFKRYYKLEFYAHFLTFIGLLLTSIGLIIGIYQYDLNNQRQKKADTIAYLQILHELIKNTDESLLEIIKYYDIDKDNISIISCDSLEIILQENHTYRKQLDDIMIGFNQLAIGCQEGFFDEMTVWSANFRMVVNVTKALIPYYELIEKERKRGKDSFVCCFLRIMVFRWEHDWTMGTKYNKMINQLAKETSRTINNSIDKDPPLVKRRVLPGIDTDTDSIHTN